jgi:DNA polymerase III subunit chi
LTEILFYHLDRQPLERVLPVLLERTIQRGWTAAVETSSVERAQALDDHLWTYAQESFLPHGLAGSDEDGQPILIAAEPGVGAERPVRFLVDGARLPAGADRHERVVLIFDGGDAQALAAAREDWKSAKAAGWPATYWQQDATGRWEKKA